MPLPAVIHCTSPYPNRPPLPCVGESRSGKLWVSPGYVEEGLAADGDEATQRSTDRDWLAHEGIGVVHEAAPRYGDGLEPSMWVLWKPRNSFSAMVHAPARWVSKVGADTMPSKRSVGAHLLIATRVAVQVVNCEEEGALTLKRKPESCGRDDSWHCRRLAADDRLKSLFVYSLLTPITPLAKGGFRFANLQ